LSLHAAILASLLAQNACSGYELSKPDHDIHSCVGTVWQVPQQQVYRELKKMEDWGWVKSREVSNKGPLGKKLYDITDAGKDHLSTWISQPCEPVATRNELLIKIFAGSLVDPEVILSEIEQHRQKHQTQLTYFEDIQARYFPEPAKLPRESKFLYLVLLNRLGKEQHWLNWCQQAKQLLTGVIVSLLLLSVFTSRTFAADLPFTVGKTWSGSQQNPENPSDLAISTVFPQKQWWLQFNDSLLNDYMTQALVNNHSLAVARARIMEYRSLARYTMAQEFPTLSLQATATRQLISPNEYPSVEGTQFTGFGIGAPYNVYTVPLQVNYEADFFLKRYDQTRSAYKQAQSKLWDYRTAEISLMTSVASTYFGLLSQDKLVELQQKYIAISEADLRAERAKMAEGLASEQTVVIKEGLLSNAKAALEDYYRLQATYRNQLAILLGKTPEEIKKMPRSDLDRFEVPQSIEAGIPSQLLTRRPDILSAEALLEKSHIDVKVARKAMLPTINLTGQAGFAAVKTVELFDWQSRIYSLAAGLVQPIFEGGAIQANIKVTKARYQEQLHQYFQTILTAFQETDTALDSLKAHRIAYQNYLAAYNDLSKDFSLQQQQLEQGDIAGADTFQTQLQMLQAQEGLVGTKISALSDALNLYKAVGGGY